MLKSLKSWCFRMCEKISCTQGYFICYYYFKFIYKLDFNINKERVLKNTKWILDEKCVLCNDLKIFNRIKTIRLQILTNERFKNTADNFRHGREGGIKFLVSVHVYLFSQYVTEIEISQMYLILVLRNGCH